jgi:AcrR family transcriptional regulator
MREMMIPTRPTYHHGDLRNSLIRAALGLVAERGVEGFSLREAARTVGVSASACYRHFADREELLAAVAHEGLDTLADKMRVAAAAHEGESAFDAVCRFWAYSEAYLHFALEHPAHFRVMHAVPKSEHSREIMLPRSPAVLAQSGMEALVAAGVVAPESAGRALLACWTSVHGLASLAVNGHLPLNDELTLEAALDAVLRTALLGAGADPALFPPEHPLPGGACPGLAELVRAPAASAPSAT